MSLGESFHVESSFLKKPRGALFLFISFTSLGQKEKKKREREREREGVGRLEREEIKGVVSPILPIQEIGKLLSFN